MKEKDFESCCNQLADELQHLAADDPDCAGTIVICSEENSTDGWTRTIMEGGLFGVLATLLFNVVEVIKTLESEAGRPLSDPVYDLIINEVADCFETGKRTLSYQDFMKAARKDKTEPCPMDRIPEQSGGLPSHALEVLDELEDAMETFPKQSFIGTICCETKDAYKTVSSCTGPDAYLCLFRMIDELRRLKPPAIPEEWYEAVPDLISDVIIGASPVARIVEGPGPQLSSEVLDSLLYGASFEDEEEALGDLEMRISAIHTAFPETIILSGFASPESGMMRLFHGGSEDGLTIMLLTLVEDWYNTLREKNLEAFRSFKSFFPNVVQRICQGESLDAIMLEETQDDPAPQNRAERRRMERNRKR